MKNTRQPNGTPSPGEILRWSVVAVGIAGLVFSALQPAFSQGRFSALTGTYKFAQEPAIIEAFHDLEASPQGGDSLGLIQQHATRVVFKNLAQLDRRLKGYDAISWTSNDGSQCLIFINIIHKSAPPEALAALIAHEAMHSDQFNSLNEEVAGWTREAEVWQEMKKQNPALDQIPLGADSLVDRENRLALELAKGSASYDHFVRSQPGYAGLPEASPGFETDPFKNNADRISNNGAANP
jgi:hypothetical protein